VVRANGWSRRPFCAQVIVIAIALLFFVSGLIEDRQSGWAARIIGILIFCTLPFVVMSIALDYREGRDEDPLRRLAWAGASLVGLGALELVLAIAARGLSWMFYSMGNH
jgi:hypothetical protein